MSNITPPADPSLAQPPADSAPQSPEFPPTAPYAAAPAATAYSAQPAAPGKNGLGVAALVLGIVAFVLAFIPFVNFVAGIIAFVGLVLGIIALVQRNKRKTTAAVGTGLNVLAGILAIVMIGVYTAMFFTAVQSSMSSDGVVVSENGEAAGDDMGTRENPAPIGSTVVISAFGQAQYEVSLAAPAWDVTAAVEAANQFNTDPAPGNQYASLPVTVTYVGDDTGNPQFELQFTYVSADGQAYDGAYVVMDGQLSEVDELYPDATGSGTVIIEIPTAAAGSGTWTVASIFGDPVFFAAE